MWWQPYVPPPPCPNCGLSGRRGKHDDAPNCDACDYQYPRTVHLSPAALVLCTACGCHYLNACPNPDHRKNTP